METLAFKWSETHHQYYCI